MSPGTSQQARDRRLEVERLLADRGLLHGPRRILSSHRRDLASEVVVAELGGVLQELGPVFAAFGRHLSLRADLLRSTDCLRLETSVDVSAPSPPERVEERLAEELGRSREKIFSAFEEAPFQSRWLDQSHHARLPGGERVVVRLIHPGREDGLEIELDAMAALQGVLSGPGFSAGEHSRGEHFREVLADFRRALAARLDLAVEADSLQLLGRDARSNHLLVVPQIYRDLSTSRVLTVQWLPGSTVDEIAAQPTLHEVDADDVARRISLIWLQMALVGHRFPIEAEVMELPDGRLAVTGGLFAALPDASRVHLWNYLRATAEHYPDRAAANLLREVSELVPGASEGELRTRVRQVVPFRDGAWSTTGESLGEYAVLHWRLLRGVGFRARPYLDDFYQGLFWAARAARRFAPQSDALGEALRDFDWLAGWNQFRQLASPRQMGITAETYMSSLVELPQKVDRILSFAAEGGFRLPRASAPARRRRNATVVVICLCLAMAALALLSDEWLALGTAAGFAAGWSEGLLAAIFLVLGLLLLRAARSSQ